MKSAIIRGVAILVLGAAALSAAVMLLWNYVIPSVVGWGALDYWQALALVILSRLLQGKMGGKSRSHARFDSRHSMASMSRSEKREYIREQMQKAEAKGNEQ